MTGKTVMDRPGIAPPFGWRTTGPPPHGSDYPLSEWWELVRHGG